MDQALSQQFACILREELLPAMGCTEPIAVAYCAALARQALGVLPQRALVRASANIIKNVKSVVVPNTGGQRGLPVAAAAGIVAGRADAQLQVLADITPAQAEEVRTWLAAHPIQVEASPSGYVFDIQVELHADGHTAFAQLAGHHTNLIRLERDGEILHQKPYQENADSAKTDRSILSVERIVEFADSVSPDEVAPVLQRQIDYNTAIAQEGLRGNWGANVGSILLHAYGDSVFNRAKAMAAAGSDARMNGCELPVVINSGSCNQGMTASLPVIVYAEHMGATQEQLYRALIVSNLITIHLKTGIGRLSAYCGATSAGCGAGAGICYLHGGRYQEIAHTIVNALAIDSGMICDGAKASCAAKIASAVEAGLLGFQMQQHGTEFYSGDGIVEKGVENTIRNVGTLAREGMRETDRTIVDIMTHIP